jgi:hypothetical protein
MIPLSLVGYAITGVGRLRTAARWQTTRDQLRTRTLILEIRFISTFERLLITLGASRMMAFNLARQITEEDPWEVLFPEKAVILGDESDLFLGVIRIICTLLRELKEGLQNNQVRPSNELRPSY